MLKIVVLHNQENGNHFQHNEKQKEFEFPEKQKEVTHIYVTRWTLDVRRWVDAALTD